MFARLPLGFFMLIFACSAPPASVFLDAAPGVDPAVRQRVTGALETHGFRRSPDRAGAARLIRLEQASWRAGAPRVNASSFILESSAWLPLLETGDVRQNLTLEEVRSGGVRLIRFAEALLHNGLPDGFLAAAVDGKYVTDPGYPLVEQTLAVVDSAQAGPGTRELSALLAGLAPQAGADDLLWAAGVGDIMLERGPEQSLWNRENGFEYVFGDTLPRLRRADVLCGNLESALTVSENRIGKSYRFRIDPRSAEYLALAGFDFLSLANNHSFDYGPAGFRDTLAALKNAGLKTAGAGQSFAEALAPARFTVRGAPVEVYAFAFYPVETPLQTGRFSPDRPHNGSGMLWLTEETVALFQGRIDPAAAAIAVVHGGYEYEDRPRPDTVARYRSLIDAGFDCVFAHHPHVLQKIESWHGGFIFYSLGNFVFPGMGGKKNAEESLIADVGFWRGRALYLRLSGVRINDDRIALDPTGRIVKRVIGLSGPAARP
jgi:hypothetical protein